MANHRKLTLQEQQMVNSAIVHNAKMLLPALASFSQWQSPDTTLQGSIIVGSLAAALAQCIITYLGDATDMDRFKEVHNEILKMIQSHIDGTLYISLRDTAQRN